jgi:peptide/nickel transport system ATP-binding protein
MPEERLRRLRGKRIALVFQEPLFALDPLMSIGRQIREAVVAHEAVSKREAEARALDALAAVRFPDPKRVLALHPHQLSGGMRQRVLAAMAAIHRPSVLIADEATSALDLETAEAIVDRFIELERQGTAILFITHDLKLAERLSGRMAVMHGGRIVDSEDPYARMLVEAAR